MNLTTRPIESEEVGLFRERLARGFGADIGENDRDESRFRRVVPLDRTVAAFDGSDLVGTLATFEFALTIPGPGTVPIAGTTMVTVQPTHRRRGALTAMMSDHLDDVVARGEPVAALWASESSIYRRYGFGVATETDEVEIDARRLDFSVPGNGGQVALIDHDAAVSVLPDVYGRVKPVRPGMLSRSDAWWQNRLHDPDHRREGWSALRRAAYTASGAVDGYLLFRQKEAWPDGFPEGRVKVSEVIAATAEAHSALWQFVTNIDLFPKVDYWNLPVDDPLHWKVARPRQIRRKRWDALWIRVLDVPAALAARRYASDGTVRFGIEDPFRPAVGGGYELDVSNGRGTCHRIDDAPSIEMGVDVLGALYLGRGGALAAASAGRITGSPEAVELLDSLFRGSVAPWCEEIF